MTEEETLAQLRKSASTGALKKIWSSSKIASDPALVPVPVPVDPVLSALDPNEERYILANDKTKLLYRRFDPSIAPKASVVLLHGFGEHAGRLIKVIQSLRSNALVVHTMDLRGHGLSGGGRASGTIDEFLDDIRLLHLMADPKLPCFLYGQSMGGLLVLAYSMYVPRSCRLHISGVIATSPWLRLHHSVRPPWFKKFVVTHLIGNMFDEFFISSNVDPCSLSNLDFVASEAINDRLCLPLITVKMARDILSNAEHCLSQAHLMTIPVVIFHGALDRLTDHVASMEFIQKASAGDKTCRIFVNAFHEIHNDSDAQFLFQEVGYWISQRLSPSSAPSKEFPSSNTSLYIENIKMNVILGKHRRQNHLLNFLWAVFYISIAYRLRKKYKKSMLASIFWPTWLVFRALITIRNYALRRKL